MTEPDESAGSAEPTDEELARAAHVRRLRTGNATSEGYRRKRHREAQSASEAAAEVAEKTHRDEDGSGEGEPSDDPGIDDRPLDLETLLAEIEDRPDLDVVELPADVPEDLNVLAVPVHEELRRELNRVGEALGMRYGFAYERDLDPKLHARPLALYLGMRQLEELDPEEVHALLERTDKLESP